MSYRFKGPKVIINGEIQHITPAPLPVTVEDGCFAVDSLDGKFKVYNESLNRWIILGDADDIVFDNTNTLFNSTNVEDALKEVSDVVEGNFNFSNAVGFEVFSDVEVSNTTLAYPAYTTKLSGTTTESGTGKYVINWFFEIANSNNNSSTWSRVEWKRSTDSTWLLLSEIDNFVGRSDKYLPVSGFVVVDVLSEDTIDFRIRYAPNGATGRIKNVNTYIFRVAT